METHWTEDEEKRSKVTRVLGWIFVALAVLQLVLGAWLYGAILLLQALFLLLAKQIERLPKVARYLLVTAFVAFAAFVFIKMVFDRLALK